MRRLGIVLVALSTSFVACSGPMVKIAPEPPAGYVTTTTGRGGACGFNLFSLIPIGTNDRARRAYDQAVKASGGIGLTDVKVVERWYYAYVGELFCTSIEGTGFTAGGSPPHP